MAAEIIIAFAVIALFAFAGLMALAHWPEIADFIERFGKRDQAAADLTPGEGAASGSGLTRTGHEALTTHDKDAQ